MKNQTFTLHEAKKDIYAWHGTNADGVRVRGESEAESELQLKGELFRQGIKLKKMKKKSSLLGSNKKKKIQSTEITVFCRQLAVMLEAGIPLVDTLESVAQDHENPAMRELIFSLQNSVSEGGSFSSALKEHKKYFDNLSCNLVFVGEQTGSLVTILHNIASYKEKNELMRKKVKKALFYPMSIIVLSLAISMALLLFVVPQFEQMFKGFGAELPAFTRLILSMSEYVQSYWYTIFLAVGIVIFLYIKAREKSPSFLYTSDDAMLKLPVVGRILQFSVVSRITRTMSISYAAGLPIVDVLKLLSEIAGNAVFKCAVLQIHDGVALGEPLHKCMRLVSLFPASAVQMVAVGENTGSLDDMLLKVANYYEAEVDNLVDNLSNLIEPLIMVVLGVLIGGFVVGMYLPIFQLGSVI